MKVLSFSNLCFLVAITIGLAAVWSVAAPAVIDGKTTVGAAESCGCTLIDAGDCPSGCSGEVPACNSEAGSTKSCKYGFAKPCSGSGSCKDARGAVACN